MDEIPTLGHHARQPIRIAPFNCSGATQGEYAALNLFSNQSRAERWPDDPPVPLDEDIRRLQHLPSMMAYWVWCAWRDSANVIACGTVTLYRTDHNRHVVDFSLEVLPECRRQGLARRLLREMVEVPHREGRRLMLASTMSVVPSGEACLRHLGADVGLTMQTSQLDIRDLNRELLPAWQQRAQERAGEFEVGMWTKGYPEDQLEFVAAAYESMNRAPRGTLDIEDSHWTTEEIREFQASERARGRERWSIFARDQATGRIVGMTEAAWHPNRPANLDQQMTGVLPEYQGRGLGRWLKAAMLEKVLRDRPQVKRIRTSNADVNASMLKINYELGFKPLLLNRFWQIETEKVRTYAQGPPPPE